jgi:dolichol kinase
LVVAVSIPIAIASRLVNKEGRQAFLKTLNVRATKVVRAAQEIERKTFHVSGVLVPLWYQTMTESFGHTERFCAQIAIGVSILVWFSEILRLNSPTFKQLFMASPFGRIMRPREMNQMTGTPYFITGCALVIALFEKQIAIASILYLIFGDMTAALVGVSFGGDTVVVKLGREGKKSVEGSVGMFAICFCIGYSLFSSVYMGEYVALVSAIVATLTELWSEDYFFELNDNLTIPTFTALALSWSLGRVATCGGD